MAKRDWLKRDKLVKVSFYRVDTEAQDSLTPQQLDDLTNSQQPISYRDVVHLWKTNSQFVDRFNEAVLEPGWTGLRFETPPINDQNFDRPFEFILLKSPSLERPLNTYAFSAHWKANEEVAAFENLGRNAMLVVPCPVDCQQPESSSFGHLASFLKTANLEQARQLWKVTAREIEKRLSSAPVWVSTAGMGVAWLHVRLDRTPKYYHYQPYKVWT